ncbi:MAG: hypothetical protein ACOCV4_05105 [Myxococcota bacterium]
MPTPWIIRLHSITGVVPLLAFVAWHAWETAAATGGRERFVLRVTGAKGSALAVTLEVGLVIVPLALHVVFGVLRLRTSGPRPGAYADRGSRVLQWGSGAVVLAFLAVHLGHTWVAKVAGLGPFGLYEALRTDLPQPLYLGVYVVGLTALCVHVGQGVGAFAATWSLAPSHGAVRVWRWAGGVAAAVLWVIVLNTVSHFATGEALLFRVDPLPAEETSGP